MKMVYEVCLYHFLIGEEYLVIYKQFDKQDEASEYARSLLDGLLPTVVASVEIKVNPQE